MEQQNKILIFELLFKKPYDLLKLEENSLRSTPLKNIQPHTSLTTRTGRKFVRFCLYSLQEPRLYEVPSQQSMPQERNSNLTLELNFYLGQIFPCHKY